MNIDRSLIPAGSHVLCAVSGGADSVCLLHLLSKEPDLRVTAAHFEHGLRGEESLRDAGFVEKLCAELGIPLVLEHGDAAAFSGEKRLGVEEGARLLRYAFLERTAAERGCDRIATAHNADDQAETMLLNLGRGTGTKGLGGIPPRRGIIVRPLLGCTRAEIERYLEENALPHVEDSSNASDAYRRNLLRHRVTPVLRQLNPRFAESFGKTAALLRQDEDCLSALAEDFLRENLDGERLPLEGLTALHPAIASRVLRKLSPRSLEREHVDAVLRFCSEPGLGFLDLPGLRLRREQGSLYFSSQPTCGLGERVLVPGESMDLPEAGLRVMSEFTVYTGEIHDLFKTYLFKCENICGRLYCTGRRPGDRYHPQGRGCGKSLHDLFRDRGMTQRERELCPVLRDEKGVLAVLGFPADERVRPQVGDSCLRITFLNF